jgi:H/ACA ribonucleoprotein complex non-core subunit NAF1
LSHRSVFYVSNISDITKYVMTAQLKAQKGSDASWKFDEEPPPEVRIPYRIVCGVLV